MIVIIIKDYEKIIKKDSSCKVAGTYSGQAKVKPYYQDLEEWGIVACVIICKGFFYSLFINLEILCVFPDICAPIIIVSKATDDSLTTSWGTGFQMSLSIIPYI